ncbi:MAG: Ig-like domain-containing protein [bacterium]
MTAALVLVVANCSSGDIVAPAETTVVSITLDPSTAQLRIGTTQQLTALATTNKGSTISSGFVYSTSTPAVAVVSSSGLVTALGIGTATITAKNGTIEKSSVITVTAGLPATITKVAGDNQTATVQSAVAIAPSVQVKDAAGNVITGATVSFGIAAGNGSITGISAATNAQGIATAGTWTLGSTVGVHAVIAVVTGVTGPITTTFTAIATARPPGPPSSIAVDAGDAQTGVIGTVLPIAPSVIVKEANGQPLANITVTFAVASGSGSIANATATTNASGIASAGAWALGAVVGMQGITATVAGVAPLTFTATATPVPTPPAQLGLARAASNASATVPFAVQPIIEIRDAAGVLVPTATNVVTATISAGGRLTGTISVAAVAGVATFTDLTPLDPGTFTVTYLSPGLASVSNTITVLSPPGGAATKLALTTQPAGGTTASPLTTQPVVELQDVASLRSLDTVSVTVTVASGPGVLSGTTTVPPVNGIVTFTDLRLSAAGTYTLKFDAAGVTSVTSIAVVVANAPAISMTITAQPAGAASGNLLATQPTLQLLNANNALAVGSTNPVTVTLQGAGGTLSGTTTVNAVNGVVTFANLRATGAGTYTLLFSSPGLFGATSSTFTITP